MQKRLVCLLLVMFANAIANHSCTLNGTLVVKYDIYFSRLKPNLVSREDRDLNLFQTSQTSNYSLS